jgi:hypothetical protein
MTTGRECDGRYAALVARQAAEPGNRVGSGSWPCVSSVNRESKR